MHDLLRMQPSERSLGYSALILPGTVSALHCPQHGCTAQSSQVVSSCAHITRMHFSSGTNEAVKVLMQHVGEPGLPAGLASRYCVA